MILCCSNLQEPKNNVDKIQAQTVHKTATKDKPTKKQISKQTHRPTDEQTDKKNIQTDI